MKVLKALTLVLSAGLLMANKECQQAPVDQTPARELKKIVDIGLIASRPIEIPGSGNFDFQFVVNQQIYPVLQNSEKFWFRYDPVFKGNQVPATNSIQLSSMNLSKNDYQFLSKNLSKIQEPTFSNDTSCLVNTAPMKIVGSVNSFELTSKFGLGIGFLNGGSISSTNIPKIGFDTESFQLDLSLGAIDTIANSSLAFVNVSAKQTKTAISFTLPFQSLLFEPSFYFQTPLAKVTYNALDKAVSGIYSQLKAAESNNKTAEWSTRVLVDHEQGVLILAGKNHGLKVGDTFDIYSEKTYWQGANGEVGIPCESKLVASIPDSYLATIEIANDINISDNYALGRIVKETGMPRPMGSLVKINKLVEPVKVNTSSGSNSNTNSDSKSSTSSSIGSSKK